MNKFFSIIFFQSSFFLSLLLLFPPLTLFISSTPTIDALW